jgi:hypothetical protein
MRLLKLWFKRDGYLKVQHRTNHGNGAKRGRETLLATEFAYITAERIAVIPHGASINNQSQKTLLHQRVGASPMASILDVDIF